MCYVDPHEEVFHEESDCKYAERDSLLEIDTDSATEYGYLPCACAS